MNWLDIVILLLLGITVIFGWINGMIRAVFGLAALMLGVMAANKGYADAEVFLEPYLASQTIRAVLIYALLFLLVALATMLVGRSITSLVKKAGLSHVDRILGALFGFAKGYAISAIIVVLISSGFQSGKVTVRHSRLAPELQDATIWFSSNLPKDLRRLLPHDMAELQRKPSRRSVSSRSKGIIEAIKKLPITVLKGGGGGKRSETTPGRSVPGRYSDRARRQLDRLIEEND